MSSYTITITPDDSSNATATVRVNLGADGPRITELTLRAGGGAGFPPGALPGLDLGMLLGAFASAAAANPPPPRRVAAKATKATKATEIKATKAKEIKETGRRSYRRMPDDVAEVYRQSGGATGVANHYDVPRHTAQGWLRRLRQQGLLPTH